jgi:hypothetical protein
LKKVWFRLDDLAVVLTAATVVATTVATSVVAAAVSTATATAAATTTVSTAATATAAVSTTTTPVAASASAAISTTAAATTARTILHRTGFIDSEVATTHVGAAESCDGCTTFVVAAHGDESESAGAAGCAVNHNDCIRDGAVCAENLAEVSVGC